MASVRREPLPILLLTGYLGAGKTTLLNHLLSTPAVRAQGPVLLINEFGTLGIDAGLVQPAGFAVYQVNSGSLFCLCTRLPLVQALTQIAATRDAGLLLVEATGVSETRDLESFLEIPTLAGRFRLEANLCVVDAAAFTGVAAFLRAASSQVAAADGLVLNKSDLATATELSRLGRLLQDLNPRAPQCLACRGQVPWEFVASLRHERWREPALKLPPQHFCAAALQFAGVAAQGSFAGAVEGLGDRLLRLKGHVRFQDGVRFVELAGGRYTEREAAPGVRGTAFTAIGWDISQGELEAAFAPAFAPEA